MADKWERQLDLYRSKDANLWICSWAGEKKPFEEMKFNSIFNRHLFDLVVPFGAEDVIYGVDLKYPKYSDGSRIYPTESSPPTEDMLMEYDGFKDLYSAYNPERDSEMGHIDLMVLEFEPDSLVGILKKMDIHPYMNSVPVHDLIRDNLRIQEEFLKMV